MALTAHGTVATRSLVERTAETQFLFKCFASPFTFRLSLSGRKFLLLPAPLHNSHTFFHFVLWKHKLVSVSWFLFSFFFSFSNQRHFPLGSVPCRLHVRGFRRLNLPFGVFFFFSVHDTPPARGQTVGGGGSQAVPCVCTLLRSPRARAEALWLSPVAVHRL